MSRQVRFVGLLLATLLLGCGPSPREGSGVAAETQRPATVKWVNAAILGDAPALVQKLASAHAIGGRRLLADAVEAAFGVHPDIVLVVDFRGFRKLIDRVGGIEVDVARPIFDPLAAEGRRRLASADFAAGRQRLDGRRALAYARSRRVDGDIGRRQRHVDLARAIVTRIRSVRSPGRAAWVGLTAVRAVRVTGSPGAVTRLAWAARRFQPSRVFGEALGAPLIQAARLPDGRYVQQAEPDELRLPVIDTELSYIFRVPVPVLPPEKMPAFRSPEVA